MESISHQKFSNKQNTLSIDHNFIDFKFYSDIYLFSKYKMDENEEKLFDFISDKEKLNINIYHNHQISDFLFSKFKAMEKIDLDDECFEGEIETRKININKNAFPKSKKFKNEKIINLPEKKTNNHNYSPKKPRNKNNNNNYYLHKKSENKNSNKNIIINHNGKVEKPKIESIDLISNINFDEIKEIKEKELVKFFSNKTLLLSIINEMSGK